MKRNKSQSQTRAGVSAAADWSQPEVVDDDDRPEKSPVSTHNTHARQHATRKHAAGGERLTDGDWRDETRRDETTGPANDRTNEKGGVGEQQQADSGGPQRCAVQTAETPTHPRTHAHTDHHLSKQE